jgi:hypothetical protein
MMPSTTPANWWMGINGVDIIRFDESGLISDFKVMVRPLKAINKVWEMMGAQLAAAKD